MTSFVDIGPECFVALEAGVETVISYKGDNYYKACNEYVGENADGGQSFCVKRVNHPGDIHEDYHGRHRVGDHRDSIIREEAK